MKQRAFALTKKQRNNVIFKANRQINLARQKKRTENLVKQWQTYMETTGANVLDDNNVIISFGRYISHSINFISSLHDTNDQAILQTAIKPIIAKNREILPPNASAIASIACLKFAKFQPVFGGDEHDQADKLCVYSMKKAAEVHRRYADFASRYAVDPALRAARHNTIWYDEFFRPFNPHAFEF